MKTLISTLALALTLGTASFAGVNATPTTAEGKNRLKLYASYESVVYPSQATPVINVIVQKEEGTSVVVRFKTNTGETLAERTVGRGKENVAMKFRVDELPDGLYSVEITNGRDITKKSIKLSTQPQTSPRTIALL